MFRRPFLSPSSLRCFFNQRSVVSSRLHDPTPGRTVISNPPPATIALTRRSDQPFNCPPLEDLIGELLQEAEEFEEEADDITSAWGDNLNQAGWGVSDGPISSFSAKGVTGNDLPNNNEVSGRSGDGRRGKSSGQTVGDTARGLDGRKTPARLNNERYEPGKLKEEGRLDPNGATGGGKKAGAGRRGLQGGTPPDFERDMERLGAKQAAMREKAQQVARQLDTTGVMGRYNFRRVTIYRGVSYNTYGHFHFIE